MSEWWKESVVYQIYPRSFKDSNGDGIGDLRGIVEKLDYLAELGIDVVWLSPVYKSPNDDMGYDISDYRDIMDEFGTLADWDDLCAGLHDRGIKLMMDLVVNHTSDEHPWFQASRKDRENPHRDFYMWRDGRDGREPNNWLSFFGGPAWAYDEGTGQWYLHLFSTKQPDLNWENPIVREEVYDMMRWWLDRGVDGFRMDVINMISKAPGLPDAKPVTAKGYGFGDEFFMFGPRLLEYLTEMKERVLSHYDTITVGETPTFTVEQAAAATNPETGPLNMVFQFQHVDVDKDPRAGTPLNWRPWTLPELKTILTRWQKGLEGRGWNSQYLSNHDQARQVSRYGNDGRYRVQSATMLATLLHLLQGTPYIFQGEEIGMTNVAFPSIEDYRDIATRNAYREMVDDLGTPPDEVMELVHRFSRDNARTPVQWDTGAHAGFTTGTPWIGVNPNYREINVAEALADPNSIFRYYQQLIRLRKANPVIVHGRYDVLLPDHESIYAFTRTLGNDRLLVVLNFIGEDTRFDLPDDLSSTGAELLITNYPVSGGEDIRSFTLRPYEARVYRLVPVHSA